MDWFLYDRDLRHERVKQTSIILLPSTGPILEKRAGSDIFKKGTVFNLRAPYFCTAVGSA